MRGDGYLPGALTLAYALKMQSNKDCICLITNDISEKARHTLQVIYDKVINIDEISVKSAVKGGRSDRNTLFTRFQALRLCEGGELGVAYDKIVLLDADILPLSNYDTLFSLNTPAGVIMENKDLCYADGRRDALKWSWHSLYEPLCPHGAQIPKEVTNRIKTDPSNMGVNSGLWVLTPSLTEYTNVIEAIHNPENKAKNFPWPEMQLGTLFWSGQWTNIDIRYCSIGGYPSPDVLYGIHFAGLKPWQRKNRSIKHYANFPDFKLWYDFFSAMYWHYEAIRELSSIKMLYKFIQAR